jgi:hypothetical protein
MQEWKNVSASNLFMLLLFSFMQSSDYDKFVHVEITMGISLLYY